jgi:hypothetical protein
MNPSRQTRQALSWRALLVGALCLLAMAPARAEPLTLLQPAEGQTIHDNAGRVLVRVAGGAPGAAYQAYLDGAPAGPVSLSASFMLTGVERGEHRLQVASVDGEGRPLARTAPVTFHMWQASRLFPNRQ